MEPVIFYDLVGEENLAGDGISKYNRTEALAVVKVSVSLSLSLSLYLSLSLSHDLSRSLALSSVILTLP